MAPEAPRSSVSRRALLGGVAGLAAGRGLPAVRAAPELTVMTRNLYVGVNLFDLFGARSMADLRRIAGRMLADVRAHPYQARIGAIADEIEATAPDVVGLQEAGLIRTQRPSDFEDDPEPNATQVVVDLLELLTSELDARGLDYEVAASTVTTDVEVPADVDDGRADVRLTDRTALLVRGDVETGTTRTGTFEAALEYPFRDTTVAIRRGYCLADLTVGDVDVTAATAHLESADAGRRREQARELLAILPDDRPVVLAGDVNSGPGAATGAYDLLADSFADAYASRRPDEDGFTCCHAGDLRNERPALSSRVDVVLARGGLQPTAVERVGEEPSDRVSAEIDGEQVRIWPSDHAGVVATFEPTTTTATPTRTSSPTPTRSPQRTATPTETRPSTTTPTAGSEGSSPSVPGFGPLVALGAFVVAALARHRRSG